MMNVTFLSMLVVMVVAIAVFVVSILFVENNESNEISETAFECGFEPFFIPRVPFSIHFFTVTVIFLIFDLEVVVLIPILFKITDWGTLFCFTWIMWLLLIGLFVEWFDASIAWQL